MDLQEDKALLKDLRNLKKLLKNMPADRKTIAEKLMVEIGFMIKTLGILRKDIETNGAVTLFKQGKQEFVRENPALKSYNAMIQRYSLLYKQITELLPKPEPISLEKDLLKDIIEKIHRQG